MLIWHWQFLLYLLRLFIVLSTAEVCSRPPDEEMKDQRDHQKHIGDKTPQDPIKRVRDISQALSVILCLLVKPFTRKSTRGTSIGFISKDLKLLQIFFQNTMLDSGFPGGMSGKEPISQCRKRHEMQIRPWVRKIPYRRKWSPTPVFLPGKSHGQRSLAGYSPWGCKESNTTEVT